MARDNPLGFGERISILRTKGGKSKDQMAEERDQKAFINNLFTGGRNVIEKAWDKARLERRKTFTLTISNDLTKVGLISRDQVADIIRQWTFETYNGRLGLERFDDTHRQVCFRVAEEPEAINEDPDLIG
ncbi:MAG: hypothetical protein AAB790_01560 [Patescibacteria group bacterium]